MTRLRIFRDEMGPRIFAFESNPHSSRQRFTWTPLTRTLIARD
jgi:hypothetical protein